MAPHSRGDEEAVPHRRVGLTLAIGPGENRRISGCRQDVPPSLASPLNNEQSAISSQLTACMCIADGRQLTAVAQHQITVNYVL
jgi:hypothetical protein